MPVDFQPNKAAPLSSVAEAAEGDIFTPEGSKPHSTPQALDKAGIAKVLPCLLLASSCHSTSTRHSCTWDHDNLVWHTLLVLLWVSEVSYYMHQAYRDESTHGFVFMTTLSAMACSFHLINNRDMLTPFP